MGPDAPPHEPLPRGRHGLSRDEVVRSQRARIFKAMAETMAAKGYARTSVSDVLRGAGVSRETFYQQFSSKEDCFMSAVEAAVDVVFAGALDTGAGEGPPMERFARGLEAYLDALATHPHLARLFLIEVYAAGPEALRRRTALQRRYAEVINDVFGLRAAEERFASEALVAAIVGLVTARIADGDPDGIRALHEPILSLAARLHDTAATAR